MTNSASALDLSALAAMKPGLGSSLAEIGGRLERFFDTPNSDSVDMKVASDELHRLIGVLKVARLDALVVFCTELDTVLGELCRMRQLSAAHLEVLRRALFGITHYLDALAHGADNAALHLFPQYRELQQLRGMEMSFELDLFYPNLAVTLPHDVLLAPVLSTEKARIKALRSQYQQGLLRWLRQDDLQAALQLMQLALDGVMRCLPQDGGRAFWWVAGGLLDCLKLDGLSPEWNARKLLGRIEQQIRMVAEDSVSDVQPVMNEMLYLIGRSHTVSDQVDAIKRAYALERYLPELTALPPGSLALLLNDMRDQLRVAEENWEQCTQGNRAACEKFVERIGHLSAQAEKLDRNTLQYLIGQIHELSKYTNSPEHLQLITVDMALALLLLDSGIEHYNSLGNGFQEQARILSERMHAAVKQQPENVQQMADMVSLHYQMEQASVTIPLANEMLANLQHVEQGLNAFFSDAGKRDELGRLLRLLNQIHGGLYILSLDHADKLLLLIREVVERFAESGAVPKLPESRALAGAVSTLENYLHRLTHGQAGDVASLQSALAEMGKLQQETAQAAAAPELNHLQDAQRPVGEDQELLEVFLEEAQEVLRIMRDNLEISQLHPDSREPLVTIRRGFHTLKGSGRMVGLMDLGDVAWRIERALNNWLRDNKPATPGLLAFIGQATQSFAAWVDALNTHGTVRIVADTLIAAAQRIEDGVDPEVPEAVVAAAVPVPVPAPAEDVVTVGEITLPAALFNIASAEAMQNVAIMHKQLAGLCMATLPAIQYDFMRAAHTLAGVNRTMGFVAVAELAYALEGWLQTQLDKGSALAAPQLSLLQRAVVMLDTMAQNVCDKQMPQPQPDLIAQLNVGKARPDGQAATPEAIAVSEAEGQSIEEQPSEAEGPSLEEQPIAPVQEQEQPAAVPRAEPETEEQQKLQARDDVDEQLLPTFLEEAEDLGPKIGAGLRAWKNAPGDAKYPDMLKRLLHTIKGSARMAGAMRIGEIAHRMEGCVQEATQKRDLATYWGNLDSDFDRIGGLIEELRGWKSKKAEAAAAPKYNRRAGDRAGVERRIEWHTLDMGAERAPLSNMLRVRSDVVDKLVNEASEISVLRSRMETELRGFKDGLLELTDSVLRLRKQLREIEIQAESRMQARVSQDRAGMEQFDPLELDRFTRLQELTRFMNESVHDVQTVQQSLLKNIDETSAAISAQARINRELQQSLMSVRMVPFSSISERLYRVVRQTGKELNKRANLELIGTSVELDRSVLEKMTAPLEHLLRNAIAHGLESEQVRVQNGKDAIGDIRISLRQESNEVVFEFSDDGAGLDFGALREKAVAKGLLKSDDAATEEQLAQLIFISGLSTAPEVTEVAGRGIGMDVVRSEIASLGGRIDLRSRKGQGVHFIIHLPLTLAVTQVLMVRAGEAIYAIPSSIVEQARQLKPGELAQIYDAQQIEWQGNTYLLRYLPHLLGDNERVPENQPHNAVLLLRSGEQRIALHVDSLQGNHEAVVKNIGPQLARLHGIAGATVRGNGSVVLIINPVQIAQRIKTLNVKHGPEGQAATQGLRTQPLVMVVDDSLTVRKITTRLLQRAGYQVVTARDGVDALEQMSEILPAVLLLDVEMPRMDGFELTRLLRHDVRTQDMPIIMITSRASEKHRSLAMQLPVDAYLGKPFQEEELLRRIAGFIPASLPASKAPDADQVPAP